MPTTIDYTTIDFETIVNELISYLELTDTFQDYNFAGSNIRTIVELVAYQAALEAYYVNAAANEVFLPTAKLYKNLNKQSKIHNYFPRGYNASTMDIVVVLDTDYTFGNEGVSISIPAYSEFTASTKTADGSTIAFVNENDILYRVKNFGLSIVLLKDILYNGTSLDGYTNTGTLSMENFSIDSSARRPFIKLDANKEQEQIVRAQLDSGSIGTITKDVQYSLQFIDGTPPSLRIVLAVDAHPEAEILRFQHSSTTGQITITQNYSTSAYYLGFLGVKNLESTLVNIASTEAGRVTQLSLTVSSGSPAFKVLVDGDVYSWTSDDTDAIPIQSAVFTDGYFASVTGDLNIIVKVSGDPLGEFSYELVIAERDASAGEVVIGTIAQSFINTDGNLDISTNPFDVTWSHVPETFVIPGVKQGVPKQSIILENGAVIADVDELDLTYNANTGRYTVGLNKISADDVRVFVKNGSQTEEWARTTNLVQLTPNSKVFYTRVNQDKVLEIWFGDGTYGMSPEGLRVNIIGLQTTGSEGNVQSSVLNDSITITGFSGRIFKSQDYFLGGIESSSVLTDTNNNTVTFTIKQGYGATTGADPEDTEEIRKNIPRSIRSQDTIVSNSDYEDFLLANYGDILADVYVATYEEAVQLGFMTEAEIENTRYFFNTIFLVTVPQNGLSLLQYQKDIILAGLSDSFRAMLTPSHRIIDASLVPIDVLVRYTRDISSLRTKTTVESDISNALATYFSRATRSIGETLAHSTLVSTCMVTGVSAVEVMMKMDDAEEFDSTDYDRDIKTTDYTGTNDLEGRLRQILLEMENKGVMKRFAPLIDYEQIIDATSGTISRVWPNGNDIRLSVTQFPILGDIILEEKT